jgi:SAM-dependent methyltransferase
VPHNLLPLRTLPWRGLEFATSRIGRFGERHGLDWLTYNPLQLRAYHLLARVDAPAVVGAIIEVFPTAQRIADVGAGSGAFAAEMIRQGRDVEACEYALAGRLYARGQKVRSRAFDLRREPPARLAGPFDLAYCFEVAEHCPPDLGDQLVAFLGELAPITVFTAARPGQGGLGHLNEQEPEYWIERFAQHGMGHDSQRAEKLCDAFARRNVNSPWFLTNLMVFVTPAHR